MSEKPVAHHQDVESFLRALYSVVLTICVWISVSPLEYLLLAVFTLLYIEPPLLKASLLAFVYFLLTLWLIRRR